ncbi:hypothetical protein SLEP1_g2584 [Rubroshorea leprosula]|uniref:Integrase catalytic domain-containing protein n=1 Tax=Rubroshorea leprosula TaxID=152421 RepID=A0AAV5HM12_9ROSI|nr:hypothetical protein SLEP1_g2584 [Rubroshorea leprosula]
MVRTFTGNHPPRENVDDQGDTQVLESDLNDFQTLPRNLFVGGAEQEQSNTLDDDERTPTGGEQPAAVVATCNSPALSNVVVPTRPRGSGKLNPEPSSSRHNEELLKKNTDLERQLKDVQKSIDELRSPRSRQQALDLDSAPLNLSITAELYQEGFKIPHLETYDGSGDPDEYLHTYQAIMRIQNATDAMMCKVFPATLKSMAKRWYHKLPRHSITSYSELATLFLNKFASQGEIKRTATELMLVYQKEGKSLRDYMQRFNKSTLDIDNVPDTICLSALLHGLKPGRFLDDLLENPPKSWNEVNDRSQILAQIQHWVKRPPPQMHDSSRTDKNKCCDYHRGYGHNTEDCQSLKDELEFLARNGKFEGGIPPPSSTINMISGGMHSGGQSARGRKAYARQVMAVNKNRPLKRPFEEAEWENASITFSPADYKRLEEEPDVMMPHVDPFVATVHIGNYNVNKVFIDTGSSPDILYWSCFQKMQLNPSSLQKMASVSFLVIRMESAFNAILGRATLCELKAVISQLHLCMKFPTPQGVGVLKGNQKMAKDCYQDTFKKVELTAALRGSFEIHRPTQLGQQTMGISDIEHQPEGVEQKAEPVKPVEAVPMNLTCQKEQLRQASSGELSTLNEACPKDSHPLPNVEKLVERAARHERMSFLNASSGYHQVQLLLDDQEKTAFYASGAIYCYVMMPFGLKNASASYQKLVHVVFKLQIGRNIEVYVDDMIVTSKFIAKSVERCFPFFKALREPKNFQWTDKCQQAFDELKQYLASAPLLLKAVEGDSLYLYLGVTKEAGVEQNYPLAKKAAFALVYTARKLRAYFQSHKIVIYTDLPLRKILQKPELSGRLIGWTIELSKYDLKFQPHTTIKGHAVADFLVESLSTTVEERAPIYLVWVLYVDGAANIEGSGAWAVLVGPDGFKSEHALRFKFQTTNNAAGYETLIYGLKLASELKLGRYASVVNKLKSGFVSFQIDKIPRADNQRVDELSKLASSQDINPQRSTIVEVLDAPSYTDFTIECRLLSTDPFLPSWTTPLVEYLQSSELLEDPSTSKLIKCSAENFTLIDNQLYKRAALMPLLCCLTPYEAEYAVREVHEGVCGTHIGGKTLARKLLRHRYYWPTMVEDAQSYVKKCPTCQFNAETFTCQVSELVLKFVQTSLDLLDPFIKGKGGCTFLAVAVDYFTKWIESKPLSTTTEKKIEEFLFNSILCRFGIPKRIIANNGPQFRAATLRSFCNDYGIELALTSVYTPQSNGQAESANKIVLRGLKTRVLVARSNWVDELNKVLWSCRTTPSSATGETLFSLAYGVKAVIPVGVDCHPIEQIGTMILVMSNF